MLIVPTTQPETIEQYSIRVAEAWKIGRKKIDDGALLVVAKDDRKLRIEVGYGLEGALNDATASRIIDEIITPKFRSGDFAGGISAGVERIIGVIDGEPLPAPAPPASRHVGSDSALFQFLNPFNPFTIIFVLLLGGAFRRLFGRLFGSVATGGLIGFLVWFVFGSLILSALAGIIASVFTMFSDAITAPTPSGRGRGGGWSQRRRQFVVRRRQQFERQRRIQRWRRQFWRRRRVGKLVGTGSMGIRRIGRHLLAHHWRVRRIFTPEVLATIEQTIKAGEATHSGQVRFVVEGALDGKPLFRDQPARERALDIFSQLRIWDTAHNNGVLIYLLLADHDVEIVADRGIDAKVGACRLGRQSARRWRPISRREISTAASIKGIEAVSRQLAAHFPKHGGGTNELPDAPVVM